MYALLGFKDLSNLNDFINTIKLELLKLNFTNTKYLIADDVFAMIAKLLIALEICLYLITNCNGRFRRLLIILCSNFAQLPLADDVLTKVIL